MTDTPSSSALPIGVFQSNDGASYSHVCVCVHVPEYYADSEAAVGSHCCTYAVSMASPVHICYRFPMTNLKWVWLPCMHGVHTRACVL